MLYFFEYSKRELKVSTGISSTSNPDDCNLALSFSKILFCIVGLALDLKAEKRVKKTFFVVRVSCPNKLTAKSWSKEKRVRKTYVLVVF